ELLFSVGVNLTGSRSAGPTIPGAGASGESARPQNKMLVPPQNDCKEGCARLFGAHTSTVGDHDPAESSFCRRRIIGKRHVMAFDFGDDLPVFFRLVPRLFPFRIIDEAFPRVFG